MDTEFSTEDIVIANLINAEVAVELGWEYCLSENIWRRENEEVEELPYYIFDLNLCQEIHNELREFEEIIYANILTSILNNGNMDAGFRPCPVIFADAYVKCVAFLTLRDKL